MQNKSWDCPQKTRKSGHPNVWNACLIIVQTFVLQHKVWSSLFMLAKNCPLRQKGTILLFEKWLRRQTYTHWWINVQNQNQDTVHLDLILNFAVLYIYTSLNPCCFIIFHSSFHDVIMCNITQRHLWLLSSFSHCRWLGCNICTGFLAP